MKNTMTSALFPTGPSRMRNSMNSENHHQLSRTMKVSNGYLTKNHGLGPSGMKR